MVGSKIECHRNLVEVIKRQNLELQRKNLELTQLYSDLRESFEALSELNIKLRAVNDELECATIYKLNLSMLLLMS